MPFQSESQRRLFHAKAARNEISPSMVDEWEQSTPEGPLPERMGKKKEAMIAAFFDELGKISTVLWEEARDPRVAKLQHPANKLDGSNVEQTRYPDYTMGGIT